MGSFCFFVLVATVLVFSLDLGAAGRDYRRHRGRRNGHFNRPPQARRDRVRRQLKLPYDPSANSGSIDGLIVFGPEDLSEEPPIRNQPSFDGGNQQGLSREPPIRNQPSFDGGNQQGLSREPPIRNQQNYDGGNQQGLSREPPIRNQPSFEGGNQQGLSREPPIRNQPSFEGGNQQGLSREPPIRNQPSFDDENLQGFPRHPPIRNQPSFDDENQQVGCGLSAFERPCLSPTDGGNVFSFDGGNTVPQIQTPVEVTRTSLLTDNNGGPTSQLTTTVFRTTTVSRTHTFYDSVVVTRTHIETSQVFDFTAETTTLSDCVVPTATVNYIHPGPLKTELVTVYSVLGMRNEDIRAQTNRMEPSVQVPFTTHRTLPMRSTTMFEFPSDGMRNEDHSTGKTRAPEKGYQYRTPPMGFAHGY